MKLYTAPEALPSRISLFLAGGISECPDWQTDVLKGIQHQPDTLIVANPRREIYSEKENAIKQIEWEHKALKISDTVSFWFPEETLCPITLYELGVISERVNTNLIVGVHPNYQRKLDVETQLRLTRPEIKIVYSIQDLITHINHTYK